MARLFESRLEASLLGSLICGAALLYAAPFPSGDFLAQAVRLERPWLFYLFAGLYDTFLFSTPYFVLSAAMSLAYIFRKKTAANVKAISLPPLPGVTPELCITVGELHHARTPEPSAKPQWLTIPARGLFTGIAIIGAIGSGKTSCCMHPFAEQILSFGRREEQVGGLVLEVKGDFCRKVLTILDRHGRHRDYLEVSLSKSSYRYNPLHNKVDAYSLAYGIATLLTSLFGRGREPFWQQAYTNMMKFIILLHRVLYDYVTLFDIYECAINPDLLKQKIELGEAALRTTKVAVVDPAIYLEIEGLSRFQWEKNQTTNQMESLLTDELAKVLLDQSVLHQVEDRNALPSGVKPIRDELLREQFQAVRRWFHEDWMRIERKRQTNPIRTAQAAWSLANRS